MGLGRHGQIFSKSRILIRPRDRISIIVYRFNFHFFIYTSPNCTVTCPSRWSSVFPPHPPPLQSLWHSQLVSSSVMGQTQGTRRRCCSKPHFTTRCAILREQKCVSSTNRPAKQLGASFNKCFHGPRSSLLCL